MSIELIVIIGLFAIIGFLAFMLITEHGRHTAEKKELMSMVEALYKQTNEIISESGTQHRLIIELRRSLEALEADNESLSRRSNELMMKIQSLETENQQLLKKIEELQKTISQINIK